MGGEIKMDVVNCPYCGGMIMEERERNYCYHCQKEFTSEELTNIKDSVIINEDMETYRMFMQYKGRS
jgi:DNA-directed RNA polymerase subunit RPC12/RpoP